MSDAAGGSTESPVDFLRERRDLVHDRLEAVVADIEPAPLASRIDHAVLAGGKRVRPTVTILACEAAGGRPDEAVDFAVGIELVHNASLVVDDIIDRASVRRSTDSAWTAFGHGQAVVVSDGLIGEAFDLFADDPEATRAVSEALTELGEGEAAELVDRPETEAEYMELARRKTGALFRAAAEVGAIAADADPVTVEGMGEYAERVGVAFQIRDDVLDATADAGRLGKPTGHDASVGRPSIVQVTDLTPTEANIRAREEARAALDAIDAVLPDSTARSSLEDLAEYVVARER